MEGEKKKIKGLEIPLELNAELILQAIEDGISKNEVIIEACKQHLKFKRTEKVLKKVLLEEWYQDNDLSNI